MYTAFFFALAFSGFFKFFFLCVDIAATASFLYVVCFSDWCSDIALTARGEQRYFYSRLCMLDTKTEEKKSENLKTR